MDKRKVKVNVRNQIEVNSRKKMKVGGIEQIVNKKYGKEVGGGKYKGLEKGIKQVS